MIPPTEAGAAALEGLAAQMRFPRQRLADLRAQAAANRLGVRRLAELADRHGTAACCGRHGRDPRLRRAPHQGRARASCPTARYSAEDVLEDDAGGERATSVCGSRRRSTGDRLRARLRRHRPAARRQPQLPALGDQVGGLLRRPRPDRPRRAALGRGLPADRGPRPGGLPAQRAAPGRRRRRQHRDLEPGRRPRDRGPRRRPPGPGPGTGDDEQPDPGRRGFTYYETIGGGQGACPDGDGPSAIHVAMSNTLNTPVEALEAEFPLRVRELSLRRGQRRRAASTAAATGSCARSKRWRRCASA